MRAESGIQCPTFVTVHSSLALLSRETNVMIDGAFSTFSCMVWRGAASYLNISPLPGPTPATGRAVPSKSGTRCRSVVSRRPPIGTNPESDPPPTQKYSQNSMLKQPGVYVRTPYPRLAAHVSMSRREPTTSESRASKGREVGGRDAAGPTISSTKRYW